MTAQSGLQRGEQVQALLAQRRQVAADATKSPRSRFAAEGARDLLLDFDHPNIALRLVIVKRHSEVGEESQNCILVHLQSIEQVDSRVAFARRLGRSSTCEPWDWFASPRAASAHSLPAKPAEPVGPDGVPHAAWPLARVLSSPAAACSGQRPTAAGRLRQ